MHLRYMKLLITCISLLFAFTASAQTRTDVKIYGYVQPVTGGASPVDAPNESGAVSAVQSERKNYYIYITGPTGQRIYPTEIWIEGKQYSTRTVSVKSPVELTIHTGETNPKKKVLVPGTSRQVYQITPSPAAPASGKVLAISQKKSAENEVVISYKLGSKMYYAVLKKLSPLEPAAMQ